MCVSRSPPLRTGCVPNCVVSQTTVPGQMTREMRLQTITRVALSIQNSFGSQYRVEVFGSTQYGVDGQTSDLDLVVIVGIFIYVSFLRK